MAKIPKHFSNIKLDQYIIMPNHVHGIIIINNDIHHHNKVEARHAWPLQRKSNQKHQYQKIPTIIGSFKSAVTKHINQINNNISFTWQKSYYDHVIRNEKDLNRIRKYIYYNPQKWEFDCNNPKNIKI